MIYLDHNATTPIRDEVLDKVMPYLMEKWGNPSSTYKFGAKLKGVIETARDQVAELLGASSREIIFTSGATESNNTALRAALKSKPGKRHVVTSAVEHSSVLTLCHELEREGFSTTKLPVDREGLLSLSDLENAITTDTALVSLMWANNETGVLFPVREIGEMCRAKGVLFHCDGVQAAGKIEIDLKSLQVDYCSISGHKLGAPKGIGALYVNRRAPFNALIWGGHQERGRRGGTECVPLIVGLGMASELSQKELPAYEHKIQPLRDALEGEILRSIERTERNGHPAQRLANTSNITFHGIDSEALLILLDQEGICASSGSACLADSDEPSHVVNAMKPETAASRQMIRFSLGLETTGDDIVAALSAIKRAVRTLRG